MTLAGTRGAAHPAGQAHTSGVVDHPGIPPVGGEHDPVWADCTGSVSRRPGLMPWLFPGQGAAVSLRAWDHQLRVRSAADPRVARFADLLAFNPDSTPEPGATCENPGFGFDPSRTD